VEVAVLAQVERVVCLALHLNQLPHPFKQLLLVQEVQELAEIVLPLLKAEIHHLVL
jgi:hypothetical protein